MKTQTKSVNYGAAQTRAEIKRHIRRIRDTRNLNISAKLNAMVDDVLNELVAFINSMAQRSGKRLGGLGRK